MRAVPKRPRPPAQLPLPVQLTGDVSASLFTGFGDNSPGHGVHPGIDIVVPVGTPITAVTGGVPSVTIAGNHTMVKVQDGSRRWDYIHVEPSSIPPAVHAAAAAGKRLRAGDVIGAVAAWGGNGAVPTDHLHLQMSKADRAGRVWTENFIGRLRFTDPFPPTIENVFVLPHRGDVAFSGSPPVVAGRVDVVVQGYDDVARVSAFPAAAPARGPFQVALSRVDVRITDAQGTEVFASRMAWARLPSDYFGQARVASPYLDSLEHNDATIQAQVDGEHGKRTFLLAATRVKRGRIDADAAWDTRACADGRCTLHVTAWDHAGNSVSRTVAVRVKNH